VALASDEVREPLERFVAGALGVPSCELTKVARLAGGTVQDNWILEARMPDQSRHRVVLRTGRVVGVKDSLPAEQEYAVLRAAANAGVCVPRPVAVCSDPAVIGRPFFLMDFVEGESRPWKLQRMPAVMAAGDEILDWVGVQLGRLQAIVPDRQALPFLRPAPRDAAREAIAEMRAYLDRHDHAHPAIECALRWLERHAPPPGPIVLCHGDFRIGNVIIDHCRPVALLDWELARWGDPHEDLAWACMRFFRFSRPDLEGGGLGARSALLRGWRATTGRAVDPWLMRYWDVFSNTRWAVVSLQQVARHVVGGEDSLELALVGLGTAEMELEALALIERACAGMPGGR